MTMSEIMKINFNIKLNELIAKKGKNNQLFTHKQYMSLLNKVKVSKNKMCRKTPDEYQRLMRYDIMQIKDSERLIVPIKNEGHPIVYYLYLEETFDIIHNCHIGLGHPGRDRMFFHLKLKYKNITTELISFYLNLCELCQKKKTASNKGPKPYNKLNSRCQADTIDMQSQADGDYKFILVYKDLPTKFIQLRPLKSNEPKEIANQLLDIFTIFGAPSILQSDNGRDFTTEVIKEASLLWPELKIVHDESQEIQPDDSAEGEHDDIEEMICTWLETNKTTKWSEGLRFIQFMKNKIHHSSLNGSPYEAMIGFKTNDGLDTSVSHETITDKELNNTLTQNGEIEIEMETEDNMKAADKFDTNTSLPLNENVKIQVKIEEKEDDDEDNYDNNSEDNKPISSLKRGNAGNSSDSKQNAKTKHQLPISVVDINRLQNHNTPDNSVKVKQKESKKRQSAEIEAESRINKNNAIAEYYQAKTLALRSEQEKIALEKIQLQGSIEKCNLKKAKLQLEIHSLSYNRNIN